MRARGKKISQGWGWGNGGGKATAVNPMGGGGGGGLIIIDRCIRGHMYIHTRCKHCVLARQKYLFLEIPLPIVL